jgi:hypothetical protein
MPSPVQVIATKPGALLRPKRRWWSRKRVWMPLAFLLGLALMIIDLRPTTARTTALSVTQIQLAKRAFDRTRRVAGQSMPSQLSLSWEEVSAVSSLAARAGGVDRVSVSQAGPAVAFAASVPLGNLFWINVGARAETSATFPLIDAQIGRLPLPSWTNGPLLWLAERLLTWRGISTPPMASMVQSLSVTPQGVTARIKIPSGSRLSAAIQKLDANPLEPPLVAARYCALAKAVQTNPTLDLATIIRGAFAIDSPATPAKNRATLVALAMIVEPRAMRDLTGDAQKLIASCRVPGRNLMLGGRQDLAKHWTVSAALTALFGQNFSDAIGQWKEMADSAPSGSGFSFVDLAADRSGVYFAMAATDEDTADATAQRLSRITESALLPTAALALSEGLSEAAFIQRYGNLDEKRFTAMKAKIDQLLRDNR